MARPLRHHGRNATVEIVTRTLQGRFLLRPSPRMVLILQGILARALHRYGIKLHAFFFASNHYHLIVTIPDLGALAQFECYINGNTAREASRLVDWEGKFWSRRYRSIEILDGDAQVERLAYVLEHGAKEGLVADPREWPGATGIHALLHGGPVQGIWVDRTALFNARRQGKNVTGAPAAAEDDFTEPTEFHLTPLPCWSWMSEAERRQRTENMIEEIVAKTAKKNMAEGRSPMGAEAVQQVDPHSHPDSPKKSNAPPCHASDPESWIDFVRRLRDFTHEYREASYQWLRGSTDVAFPEDCFLPPIPFADPFDVARFPT
jgi:REP element-mobilizing transposase RayT